MITRSDKVWEVTSDSGEMQATIVSVRRIKDTPSSIFQIMYFFNSRFRNGSLGDFDILKSNFV